MDARVNDFLNEINEIAPLNESKAENVWEKCYDEDSGYYYYWNTKTNEVTWDMPSEYRAHHKSKSKKSTNLYVPPRTAPLFPSTSILPPVSDAIKIYKIGECTDTIANTISRLNKTIKNESVGNVSKEEKKYVTSKTLQKKTDTEDEKVILISSYGQGSESEEEDPPRENKQVNGLKTEQSTPSNSDDEDDGDILTKIQKKATELKKLEMTQIIEKPKSPLPLKKPEQKTSKVSLVVGYSDSEEEMDAESPKPNFLPIAPSPPQENKVSHSRLFPVIKPIDIKDFEDSSKISEGEEGFDTKAFQRKRRIGVALVNTRKQFKGDDKNEFKGLGFSSDSNSGDNLTCSAHPEFKSVGVMFVKADVLNPSSIPNTDGDTSREKSDRILKEIEDTYVTLTEKLGFLSEGREQVSPVQVMVIQLETLYAALKSGDLKQKYLRKWLDETCSELVKLEKETTPEGWLLQWDRTHKRYYYQNAATGESQWEYPQADVTVCDEAMDICTTPPPNEAEQIHMSPPLPPVIGSPSPPPPPTISDSKLNHEKKKCDIPLPPEPKEAIPSVSMPVEKFNSNDEPLPPGVDTFDLLTKVKDPKTTDLNDVLSSFYSDIAAIENCNSPTVSSADGETKTDISENVSEVTKKKKKKVKLAQGIAMKKKGVSKLVEKWKNVQMSYND